MTSSPRPVLCIIHHEPDDPGLVGEWLTRTGRAVQLCQPNAGDPLPAPERVGAAIIFGGTMSANDDHDPAIRAELDWIGHAQSHGTPLFGICLGGQMISRVMGGSVARHADGLWEIGYRRIAPTQAGRDLFAEADTFFQWHKEGFTPPPGAELLAAGTDFANQAFRLGPHVLGVQFHPEVSAAGLASWHRRFASEMDKPGGDPIAKQQAEDLRFRPHVSRWLEQVLPAWLSETGA